MTAKEYLKQAWLLEAEINRLTDKLTYWRSLAFKISSGGFEMNYNVSRPCEASFVDTLAMIEEKEREIDKKLCRLLNLRAEIESQIDKLPNKDERLVLHYRYVDHRAWNDICRQLHVSKRTVFRIQEEALKKIFVPF